MTLAEGRGARVAGRPWPPDSLSAERGGSARTALTWLELTEGAAREALAERLAQAHMSGVLAEALAETAPRPTLEQP